MDVKTAFLNENLIKQLHAKIPDSLNMDGNKFVHKSVYGLQVAPKCWNKNLDEAFKILEFKNFHLEPFVYIWTHKNKVINTAIYVDHIIFAFNNDKFNKVKMNLESLFDMTDLEEPKK